MNKKQKKIRFKKDDGTDYPDWESVYLGDITDITTGKLNANAMVENGKYPFFTCAKESYNIDTYAFDTEALLISGNGANVGYIHYYKGKFNAYQRTYVLDNFKANILYTYYLLENILHKRIASEVKDGNTPYIVKSTLSDLEIALPELAEQQKIAACFSSLDDLITAHQEKLTNLKAHKKGLLQNLFPKAGEKVPRLRFPEFEGDWEEKPLGKVMSVRNDQAPKSKEYPLMAFIKHKGVVPKGDRYNRDFLVNDSDGKKYKKTEYGDFIYSSNNIDTGSVGLNTYGSASISPVYSIFKMRKLVNSRFIGYYLIRKEFINKMIKFRQGVVYGQFKIHESNILQIKIPIPSPKEQQKIAACLSSLDDLITAQEQKIKQLQAHKKGLLQKMFI